MAWVIVWKPVLNCCGEKAKVKWNLTSGGETMSGVDDKSGTHSLLLAHGSGQPANSEWMLQLSSALEAEGIHVLRFNFHYMDLAQESGKPRPPSRLPVLLDEFRKQVAACETKKLFIGGKSLGGRVASHLATESDDIAGVLAFGYPFHPPGKPDKLRTEHLPELKCPMLICQGERDPFGKRDEVEAYKLPALIRLEWLNDGDHQLKPRKRAETTLEENLQQAARAAKAFMTAIA